jgi:hypothetical protein
MARFEPSGAAEAPPAGGDAGRANETCAPLDLADLYAPGQLLADRDGDFAADDAACGLVIEGAVSPADLCHVAARLGLESVGLTLPFAGPRSIRFREGSGRVAVLSGEDGVEDLVVEGAAAAAWLAGAAPGPAGGRDPLSRTVQRIRRAIDREDVPPPPERVAREAVRVFPWEVDDVRAAIRAEVAPAILPGSVVAVDIRVSETRAVREALRDELAASIAAAGATPRVTVRAVYKAGLCWLVEEVGPLLAGIPGASLVVRCRSFEERPGEEWVSADAIHELRLIDPARADELQARVDRDGRGSLWKEPPIRWLLEVYPADEVLPIPMDRVSFAVVPDLPHVYEAEIRDGEGATRAVFGFDPRWTERPWLDAFPELGLVHPVTGWVSATVDDAIVLDRRIATDAERIWECFQEEVLPALADHARRVSDGRLDQESQPFFGAVELHVEASEPDEELQVREERISALEALHEDLYFVTLEFFSRLGEQEGAGKLGAPGQVIPWLHERAGQGARLHWRLLEAPPRQAGAGSARVRLTEVIVREDGGIDRCRAEVSLPSADAVSDAREALARLAGRVQVDAVCSLVVDGVACGEIAIPAGRRDEGPELAGSGRGRRLRRDAVPGYEEHLELLDDVAGLAGVRLWRAGRSVQGRALWAVESVLPGGGALRSHVKQIAWKPTLLINARHHGNEPSSTISALETVRRHAEDSAWAEIRRRVNLVALPFENVDGGELSWRMHRDHPRWMLHAGRYNALGLEFRSAYGDPDHPSRESSALPALWRRWLPDIVVDDHGFPSHEWVQPFSGYIPKWPAYWIPRGLVYAYLGWVDDPGYPDHRRLKQRVRDLMEEETGRDAEIVAMNERWAERYRTYAQGEMPETFPFEPYESLLVYDTPSPPDPGGSWTTWGSDFGTLYPEITSLSFVTEVADETAQGPYMDACARA